MAYVTPNSTVYLCKGVPLDREHDFAIYFASASAQYSALHAYATKTYTTESYQRVNKRTIRINELADNIQTCNYMIFQNTAFGTKWFYAFVDEVNYINNSVSEVVYTIDPLQTYLFDFYWNACLVEREHTATDVVGENVAPEPISTPNYNYEPITRKTFTNFATVVMCTKDLTVDPSGYQSADDWGAAMPNIVDGILQGAGFYAFSNLNDLRAKLKKLQDLGLSDAVVGLFGVPLDLLTSWTLGTAPQSTTSSTTANITFGTLSGYTPKNKKLYTSPFCKLYLSGNGVQTKDFDVQGFTYIGMIPTGFSATFICTCACSPGSPIVVYPSNYRGIGGTSPVYGNKENAVSLGSAIGGSWNASAYANWQAQTATERTLRGVGAVVGAGVAIGSAVVTEGATLPLVVGAVGNVISTGVSLAAENAKMQNLPNRLQGGAVSADVNLARGDFGFAVYFAVPTADNAKRIDNFFTRYGYACNKIKIPSINNRPYWTYVKTNGCSFTPKTTGVPAPDMEAINGYFDRGITWFKTAADVGDFSKDNSV